jgi:L-threonylcarbamoyladenylate synthase
VGIESTIVDATRGALVILRPGHYTAAQLSEWAGEPVLSQDALAQAAPKASGTLDSHYAPQARVRLWPRDRLRAMATEAVTTPLGVAVWSPDPPPAGWSGPWRIQPLDAHDCARQLFATLRELDASGVREIWVSEVPEGEAWAGVADRLRRAAT